MDLMFSELIEYDMATLRPWLPDEVENILDIGAGLAAIDVRLYEVYPDAYFYLLDKPGFDARYGLETVGVFYTSFAQANMLLRKNGVPPKQYEFVEAQEDYSIEVEGIDFCLSLFSWGWHYPLGAYVDAVAQAVVEGGTLILDVRNREGEEDLLDYFAKLGSIPLFDGHREVYRRVY